MSSCEVGEGENCTSETVNDEFRTNSIPAYQTSMAPTSIILDVVAVPAGLPIDSGTSSGNMPSGSPHWFKAVQGVLQNAIVPPVLASLTAIVIGLVPQLRGLLVDTHDQDCDAPLEWLYNGLSKLGEAAVPLNLLILGASLSKGANFSALPMRTCISLVMSKMVLMPLISVGVVYVLSHIIHVGHPQDKSLWLVSLVVACTPTANNITVMVELAGQNKEAMATALFVQYLVAPLLLTLSLTGFIAILQSHWFLPVSGLSAQSVASLSAVGHIFV